MPATPSTKQMLQVISDHSTTTGRGVSSSELATLTGASIATVKRQLERLVSDGKLIRRGVARATRYHLPSSDATLPSAPHWSKASLALQKALSSPLAAREPVGYRRDFVDLYEPNKTRLIPPDLAESLIESGRMRGQQPAGTYARKILEQLLIDLSWSSSRLEGNRYSLLATEALFKSGTADADPDAVMLLNHKRAIEFLVDAVPSQGLTAGLIRNLHALLMQDLLADSDALGSIRHQVVNISDTTYVPSQLPALLEEMLSRIIDKASRIKNPLEAAFFLWVNLAYLQPFEDGNKRTSRLTANVPLMLYNLAPLAFLDVEPQHYAQAMLGVFEFCDVSMAVDLFVWTYRRSIKKYAVVIEAMGVPNPLRLRYREWLIEAVGRVVRDGRNAPAALAEIGADENSAPGLAALLDEELDKLENFNCARYRLTAHTTDAWIAAGRPR